MATRARGVKQDLYANIAHIQVTESAANTLTFKKLETGISLFEKVAWIIHRVEYFWLLAGTIAGAADGVTAAIATSDNASDITPDESSLVDILLMIRKDFGTAASAQIVTDPFFKDFTQLPGGGLIVPPNPIYLAAKGTSQAAAQVVDARIFYTAKSLRAEEYWELVEARRIITSA